MTTTENLGLKKPDSTDPIDISVLNENADTLDEFAGDVNDALAAKQDTISDLSEIRSGAAAGATAVQQTEFEADQQRQDAIESEDRAALVQQIDGGAKNILDFVNLSGAGGSATVVKDGNSIAVTGIASWSSAAYKLPILPAGTYTFSALVSNYSVLGGAARIIVTKTVGGQQEVGGITLDANGKINFNFISDGEQLYLLYYPNYSKGSHANSFTASQNMICTKAAWDISQTYVPYAPTNRELYEMILALQNQS